MEQYLAPVTNLHSPEPQQQHENTSTTGTAMPNTPFNASREFQNAKLNNIDLLKASFPHHPAQEDASN